LTALGVRSSKRVRDDRVLMISTGGLLSEMAVVGPSYALVLNAVDAVALAEGPRLSRQKLQSVLRELSSIGQTAKDGLAALWSTEDEYQCTGLNVPLPALALESLCQMPRPVRPERVSSSGQLNAVDLLTLSEPVYPVYTVYRAASYTLNGRYAELRIASLRRVLAYLALLVSGVLALLVHCYGGAAGRSSAPAIIHAFMAHRHSRESDEE